MEQKKRHILLGALIIIAVLVELFIFNQQYTTRKFSHLEQRRLLVENGILYQISYENGVLVSEGIDPYVTFENINMQIASISIKCKNSIVTSSGQIYYQGNDQTLNSITYKPSLDGSEIILPLSKPQFVSDLRIDPSNREGDVITCQEFVVNPPPQFHIALTRLVLYVCLLALAILELSTGVNLRRKYFQNLLSPFLSLTEYISHKSFKNKLLLLPLMWVLLWILPWAGWLNIFPWLRLGISLLLFVIPGLIVSMLLAGVRFSLSGHFSSGLAFSVFFVGVLGFTGRIFHWPFEYIKYLFALSGLIALIKYSALNYPLYKPARVSGRNLILLLFMIIFGIITNFHSRFSVDDLSYLAYLTNWQHVPMLNFEEVIFGTGVIDSVRFWWGMFPMSLALLAEISHLHGLLLLGFYLEPFLVTFAILAFYNLYEDLLSSENSAIIALLLHFTFLFLVSPLHRYFFEEISEDKVFAAFALTPVLFLALRYFLGSFTARSGIFFLLSGYSLVLTHVIILAYVGFIAGVYVAIETMIKREYKNFGVAILLLFIIIAPSASLRFVDQAWISRSVFGLKPWLAMPDTFHLATALETPDINNLISYIEGTPFYGINLEKIRIKSNSTAVDPLPIFLSWSYVWILGLGFLWSLFNLKKDVAARFIAACSLLVILCAFPYTGWLFGYFVTARLLWRVLWLLPIGLISFTLLRELFTALIANVSIGTRIKIPSKQVLFVCLSTMCVVLIGYFSEFVYQYQGQSTKAQFDGYRNHLTRFAELGYYLEYNVEQPVRFVAPFELMNYLPGLSTKSKAVIFRVKDWTPYPIDEHEIGSIFSNDPSISMEKRMHILDKYQIKYVLIKQPSLKEYYAGSPQYFELQYTNDYWLFKFRDVNP